jgi:DNA polymerase-3 subunit alpha
LLAAYKIKQAALTDINNTSGVFDFVKLCRQKGIEPVVGVEFRTLDCNLRFIALAKNNEGFSEINRYLSAILEQKNYELPLPHWKHVWVIYPYNDADNYAHLKPYEYVGVRHHQIARMQYIGNLPVQKAVAWHTFTFAEKKHYNLHRLLRAIDKNELLSKMKAQDYAVPDDHTFCTPEVVSQKFSTAPELLNNAETLLDSCHFEFDFKTAKNKKHYLSTAAEDHDLLRKLAYDGCSYRYGSNNAEAKKRIANELQVIEQLGFAGYFLITWDMVRFAKEQGFFHVGRGSGANSMVAYCLGITDVDPIELDLYFERFINPYRTSPPDFDIDFSWDERGIMQRYLFEKYGFDHVAMIGTYTTYQGSSIAREICKVLGVSKAETDAFISNPDKYKGTQLAHWVQLYGSMMKDMPNYVSIHAGGIIISELPISYYTATNHLPVGLPSTQFDMYVAEDIGFAKFDVLSQRGLGHIKETVDIIRENRGIEVNVHAIQQFKNDPHIQDQLEQANTLGCFYIESPAMRQLLKKLKCRDYITLVAASSIIRPGVSKSGMMKAYIHRFHHPEQVEYIHPVMEQLLKETYGVMVYQEDVIKVAHHFAGLSAAESDVLRRGMSGKFRSRAEFERIKQSFFDNCDAKGYPKAITAEVWRQIESFSGYSFSKAHSASFAVESFQSLFLKTYYPLEFMVGVINNFGGFYRTEIYVHEARMNGAKIHAPCINRSKYKTCIKGTDIYLGFIHIKGLEQKIAKLIETERAKNGDYVSLENFIQRVNPGLEQLILLIRIGALRTLGKSKKEWLWLGHLHYQSGARHLSVPTLFETGAEINPDLPILTASTLIEDAYDELELLGFPLCHFGELFAGYDTSMYPLTADTLGSYKGQQISILGYLVTYKPVRTVKNDIMYFGTFLDDKGHFFDTVHFPDSLKKYPIRGPGAYLITGKVVEEFGFFSVEATQCTKLDRKPDPRVV